MSSSREALSAQLEDDAAELLAAIEEKFADEMEKEEQDWCTHNMAKVYASCRTTKAARIQMLGAAIEWRIKRRAMLVSKRCPLCSSDPLSHDARIFGTDANGDVVLMNCFALPHNLNPSGIANHMACLFERALLHFPPASGSTELRQWTWCIDVHGFGIRHTDPRTTMELLKLLECAYPERLKKMLIIDAPTIFWGLWTIVKPFIQEKTVAKIEFVSWSNAPRRYEELLGKTVADRLVTEGAKPFPPRISLTHNPCKHGQRESCVCA